MYIITLYCFTLVLIYRCEELLDVLIQILEYMVCVTEFASSDVQALRDLAQLIDSVIVLSVR